MLWTFVCISSWTFLLPRLLYVVNYVYSKLLWTPLCVILYVVNYVMSQLLWTPLCVLLYVMSQLLWTPLCVLLYVMWWTMCTTKGFGVCFDTLLWQQRQTNGRFSVHPKRQRPRRIHHTTKRSAWLGVSGRQRLAGTCSLNIAAHPRNANVHGVSTLQRNTLRGLAFL